MDDYSWSLPRFAPITEELATNDLVEITKRGNRRMACLNDQGRELSRLIYLRPVTKAVWAENERTARLDP